jgi:hypothetical protein
VNVVLASAASERYGFHLLNMIGSVQTNSPGSFERIVVYDLGLSGRQRRLASSIDGVELRPMPHFSPHWAQGFTWKPWIWTHVEADAIFYLDAGATVLRRLSGVTKQIAERGYWVVSQGHAASTIFPSSWYELYGITREAAERPAVAAGIIGFRTSGRFWDDVVVPTYEDCLAGRSRGFSAHEVERINRGFGRDDSPPLYDAQVFRHDQSVLNARLLVAYPDDLVVADLDEYAGFRSPRDHPEQVIWSHRRGGDFRFIPRARYRGRIAAVGIAWGTAMFLRNRTRHYRWLLRPAVYAHVARRLLSSGRLRAPR